MNFKVCKFGGSSLADANQFKKVKDIVAADSSRKVVVVSAPGKRSQKDRKITDMLVICQELAVENYDFKNVYAEICTRFNDIAQALDLNFDIAGLLEQTRLEIEKNPRIDFVLSRGEYLNGKIMAEYLGAKYIEPQDNIIIDADNQVNVATYENLKQHLTGANLYVMPGFYGSCTAGKVKTFSRGGSDISGAIIARAMGADLYENWTDVSGFLMADPRIVDTPKPIKELTYKELRELSYMGANVLHDESIFPIQDIGIPIEILNTNDPLGNSTRIVAKRDSDKRIVTGIAGRKDFILIQIEKTLMNKMIGFGRKVLQIFEDYGLSYDHMPTGIDTMSVVLSEKDFDLHEKAVLNELRCILKPDKISLTRNLAIIATVGQEMVKSIGFAGRLCSALADANINLHIIDLGSTEDNMIVGINNKHYEKAINAIYDEFVKH